MQTITLEVCVDTADGLAAAIAGGADRIELCSALALGGMTPLPGLLQIAATSAVPVHAMVRPREGDFVFGPADITAMVADVAAVKAAGLAGVVIGANRPDGTLDLPVLQHLADAAQGLDITLHRAFDLVPDMPAALDQVIALGIPRILTSGGARTAIDGVATLARLFHHAAGRVSIMPGAGITARTVAHLRHLPLREIHASCAAAYPVDPAAVRLGFSAPERRQTDIANVRALRAALAH